MNNRTHLNDENDFLEDDDTDNIFILNDENGRECRFELLDLIDYKGREFLVLLSDEEAAKEESEVDILEVVPVKGNPELESYLPVEEEDVVDAVFEIFMENNKDTMDFC